MSNLSGFNPKARWDKNIPQTEENQNNLEELNEKIEVLALFKNAKIFPQSFSWKNKQYKVDKINYIWQERRGQEVINYFSLLVGSDSYQISFSNTTYSWKIDKIL